MPRKDKPKPDPTVIRARQMKWLTARWKRAAMTPEQIAEERAQLDIDIQVSIYVRELEANDWQIPE